MLASVPNTIHQSIHNNMNELCVVIDEEMRIQRISPDYCVTYVHRLLKIMLIRFKVNNIMNHKWYMACNCSESTSLKDHLYYIVNISVNWSKIKHSEETFDLIDIKQLCSIVSKTFRNTENYDEYAILCREIDEDYTVWNQIIYFEIEEESNRLLIQDAYHDYYNNMIIYKSQLLQIAQYEKNIYSVKKQIYQTIEYMTKLL